MSLWLNRPSFRSEAFVIRCGRTKRPMRGAVSRHRPVRFILRRLGGLGGFGLGLGAGSGANDDIEAVGLQGLLAAQVQALQGIAGGGEQVQDGVRRAGGLAGGDAEVRVEFLVERLKLRGESLDLLAFGVGFVERGLELGDQGGRQFHGGGGVLHSVGVLGEQGFEKVEQLIRAAVGDFDFDGCACHISGWFGVPPESRWQGLAGGKSSVRCFDEPGISFVQTRISPVPPIRPGAEP